MDTSKTTVVKTLMLPWVAHGHLSPYLELAKRLTKRNFHVYICSTPANLHSIKKNASKKWCPLIELVELHLPSSPELPPHQHTTNGLPPHLMGTLKLAVQMAGPKFSNIVSNLKPDLVIYDFNQPWAAEIASFFNIPAVHFNTGSAAMLLHCVYNWETNPGQEFPYPEICPKEYKNSNPHLQLLMSLTKDDREVDLFLRALKRSQSIILVKTCREMEAKYIDHLSKISKKRIVPVGPLVNQDSLNGDGNEEIMEWLEKKYKKSVVFVSFGSEYFLSEEERNEVAKALELSMVSFIWAVRFPKDKKIKIEEATPRGFLDRVKNRGLVVEGWAPQARILGHPSTGGFVSHCGWSSIMESMKSGVPIVALPIQVDQPFNARLVEAIGVGMEAVRDESGKLQHEEIAKVIRKVVVEESGQDVRKKMRQMSKNLNVKMEDEIDGVVEELVALTKMKNAI